VQETAPAFSSFAKRLPREAQREREREREQEILPPFENHLRTTTSRAR
jgi:hypothetical protein